MKVSDKTWAEARKPILDILTRNNARNSRVAGKEDRLTRPYDELTPEEIGF